MSALYPNKSDSIKEKCSKACYLWLIDYISDTVFVDYLTQFKNDFQNHKLDNSEILRRFQK